MFLRTKCPGKSQRVNKQTHMVREHDHTATAKFWLVPPKQWNKRIYKRLRKLYINTYFRNLTLPSENRGHNETKVAQIIAHIKNKKQGATKSIETLFEPPSRQFNSNELIAFDK